MGELIMPEALPRATPVTVAKDEPYPTGAPPDNRAVFLRVHPYQSSTAAKDWEAQRVANLAAHGVIAGAAPITPTVVEDPEEGPEADGVEYVDTPRGRK